MNVTFQCKYMIFQHELKCVYVFIITGLIVMKVNHNYKYNNVIHSYRIHNDNQWRN